MKNLPTLFTEILSKYTLVTDYSGPQKDQKFEDLVNTACVLCEKAIELINELELFSKNETLDDLTAVEIRYMLLPAFLAFFKSYKNVDRLSNLQSAEFLYGVFLKLTNENGVKPPVELPNIEKQNPLLKPTIERLTSDRENKIKRHKAKKSLEDQLEKLSAYVDQPNIDEDVKRNYNLTLTQNWILKAYEELPNLRLEIDLLKYKEENGSDVGSAIGERVAQNESTMAKFKPFILTRSEAQAAVFGAGYPSLPTMTIDQFYEQQVAQGILPPAKPVLSSENCFNSRDEAPKLSFRRIDPSNEERAHAEQKNAKDDALEDADDDEYLAKARRFDAFKDDNRRGDGNRMNRG